MPSDATIEEAVVPDAVVDVLRAPRDAFHSALVTSSEELRGMLQEAEASGEDHAVQLSAELGPFAAERIDTGRLAAVLTRSASALPASVDVLSRAADVMDELLGGGGADPVEVEVPPGGDLRDSVRDALTGVGRAFGAARVADLARSGSYRSAEHEGLFDGLPFRAWTSLERLLAPPVVVRVQGDDLRPAGLADFLDGATKILLLVEGAPPPAALARLVTPGVMVVQARSAEELGPIGGYSGPAVAALFVGAGADDAIPFLHDPRRGALSWRRIELGVDPDELRDDLEGKRWPKRGWREDVGHLLELATPPSGDEVDGEDAGADAASTPPGTGPATEADRLASWLIARTDLGES